MSTPTPDPQHPGGPTGPRGDRQSLAVLTHLSALVWVLGIPGVVGPLVMWLIYRQDPELEPHGREALNFHLSVLIYLAVLAAVGIVLVFTIIGVLLVPFLIIAGVAVLLGELVVTIVAAVSASNGQLYRYPLSLRLIG